MMNRSTFAPALLFLAALCLSAWWLLGSSESPPPTPTSSAAPAPEAQVVRADPSLEDAAPELVPELAPAREQVVEAAADAEPAPLEPALLLRVTHAATGQPAVGAEVLFWQRIENWLRWGALQLCASGFDASAEKLGEPLVFETGELGRASLPTAWPAGLIMVRLGDEVAFEFVDADLEGELELTIRPATSVVVRVVDLLGRPRPGAEVSMNAYFNERFQADESGRLELAYVTDLLALLAEEVTLDASMTKPTVGGGFMGGSTKQVFPEDPHSKESFSAAAPPVEIELVTLAMGLVRVELIDATGRPAKIGFPMLTFELDLEGLRWKGGYTDVPAGAVLDSWYPSGAAFKARFQDVQAGAPAETLEGVMPAPGEPPVVWRIEVDGAPEATLAGRLVDDAGEPLVRFDFGLAMNVESLFMGKRWSGGSSAPQPLRTDAEGHFRVELTPFMVKSLQEPERWLTLRFVDQGRGTTGTRSAKLELVDPGAPEVIELGDVALVQPPLVAAGRFVDRVGEPVEGVSFMIRLGAPATAGDALAIAGYLDNRRQWKADAGGQFEARSAGVSGPIEVCATAAGWIQAEPALYDAGASGLEVRLMRAGALSGSVERPAGAPMVYAKLQPAAGVEPSPRNPSPMLPASASGNWSLNSPVDGEGRFHFNDLAPGLYDVQFLVGSPMPFSPEGKLVLEVTDVEVHPGQAAPEPRLEGLLLELESAE